MSTTSIFIAIAGGAASGKKTVQAALEASLLSLSAGSFVVETLHQADFLIPSSQLPSSPSLDPERLEAYDLSALADVVARVRAGEADVPVSCGKEGAQRTLATRPDVIIAEGTYVLCSARIVEMADVKIFVDCDADVRLARRVVRDLAAQRALDGIFEQHVRHSKVSYERSILPTKQLSDIILPGGGSVDAGVELIAQGVVDDISAGRKPGTTPNTVVLPLMLSEADLSMGVPSYYETV